MAQPQERPAVRHHPALEHLRWRESRQGWPAGRNALLIVTRLPPGLVCHVAYIDVKANREPNALARAAADETARNFNCAKDKVRIVGERGRAIELAGQK